MRDDPTSKLYLYLARRDKRAIKILTTFRGHAVPPTRVQDIRQLGLPREMANKLNQIIQDDRLLWEPWVESAESFDQLRTSLSNRGYKAPRKSTQRFQSNAVLNSNVRGLDKVRPSSQVQTNRVPLRKTMLGG